MLDQQTAFDLAKDGHNLVVIVQGGCGENISYQTNRELFTFKGENCY